MCLEIIVKSENKLTLNGIDSTLPLVGAGLPSPYGQSCVQIIMGFTIKKVCKIGYEGFAKSAKFTQLWFVDPLLVWVLLIGTIIAISSMC